MKKLSEYTIATNCADIVDCQDGVAEIREEIGRRYEKKQDVPLYFYSRLDKLEKKLEKLAMKNYGMSYREAVIKFGYDNLRGMGKTSDEEKMKKSLKFKVGDYIEHTASAPFYHKVTAVGDLYYTTETYDYVTHQRRGTSKVGIGAQDVYRKIDNPQSDKSDISLFQFAQLLSSRFDDGESYDWAKVHKMAKELGVKSTQQELMQACELAVVLSARQIAHNGQSIAQRFAAMKDLYGQQVTVRPLDTQSKILQQYSTPCPLAFLLGVFVDKNDQFWNGRILEPSAGNGLLTVALHESQTVVNEIDEIRVANLKQLGFASVTSEDASSESAMQKFGNKFRGIITNPPFAKLADKDKIERHGWPINTLDYKMAVLALDHMSDNGKAAIIVGGKMWNSYWKPLSERSEKQVLFGQWKTFLGYLYAQYNVADVIYINGENIYRKQGTTYPIVAILVDGRHEYDESVKPNYVFDSERDVIIDTFDQLLERIMPHLDPHRQDETPAISLLKAKFGKNVRPSGYEATGDNPIHAYKYPTGTMYADTRFQMHDNSGWDFLPIVFKFDSGTIEVKCNVLPEYEQLIDRLKNDDMRKRLARAKAKALLILAFKMKMEIDSLPHRGDVFVLEKKWQKADAWLDKDEKSFYDFYSIADVIKGEIVVIDEQSFKTMFYTPDEFKKKGFKFHHHQNDYGELVGIDENFADKLNEFIENGYSLVDRKDYFSCGYANDILEACGLDKSFEIIITQSGMKKIIGQKKGKQDEAHNLTPIEVLRLPQLICSPILVIQGKQSDTRLVFVEIPRSGRKVFAAINLDFNMNLKNGFSFYNLVASVYSQEYYKIAEKIISANASNSIFYYDSNKIKNWLSEIGQHQFLPNITANSMYSDIDFPNTPQK